MRAAGAVVVVLLFFGLVSISCGKKGDPFLPSKETLGQVTDFEGAWTGEEVLLTGRIQEPAELGEGRACRVYYAEYPEDRSPCDGCPVEYQGYRSFGSDIVNRGSFSFRMPEVRRGNVYFFEARLVGLDGSLGPPSNRVRVDVPEE